MHTTRSGPDYVETCGSSKSGSEYYPVGEALEIFVRLS